MSHKLRNVVNFIWEI